MRFSQALAVLCIGFLVPVSTTLAEGTLSSSNTLTDEVNVQIVTMLGQETSALRRASSERLSELASPSPKRVRRGWLFGRKKTDPIDDYPHTRASLARMPVTKGDAQWACLTEALYFEARGESVKGQFAVAEVILNRVDSRSFPRTVCSVVRQGTGNGKHACQFSYKCDGKNENMTEKGAYHRAGKIAKLMLEGEPRILTKGATYYHSTAVNPSWARKFTNTTKIGVHKFYRDPRRISLN